MKPIADIVQTSGGRAPADSSPRFDPYRIRQDFPILSSIVHGKPLVYLDNGATTQKPRSVIETITRYYERENANIHRGVYYLSQLATEAYESARGTVARFINASEEREIIFTSGATQGINLVASSWGRTFLRPGDEVVVSALEHHSNIVPWQMACETSGARLRVIPMNDAGELMLDEYAGLLSDRTKMVAVGHISNSLGTINDVNRITRMAHEVGAKALIDGAQWVAHHPTDVREIDCDFYVFSGHKLYGPTGIGVLYGKQELLEAMHPYQGGGDMIESVTFEKTTYAKLPNKFEAGTPNIAGAIGLATAIDYVTAIGFDAFESHEADLLDYATGQLKRVPGLRIVGTAAKKGGVISFLLENPAISPIDVGTRLDLEGIAVRTGHHCCQPVMDRLKISATTRASFALYNTKEDVDSLVRGLLKIASSAASSQPTTASATPVDPTFPKPAADSPDAAANELADNFEILGDRSARNQYVLDLAERLPHTFDLLKKVTPRVTGCMSEVYLVPRTVPGTGDLLEFAADANSDIVRGLIAILQRLYSGQRADAILRFDIDKFFHRIGLDQFITSQRRNGLAGMVQRIRAAAEAIAHRDRDQGRP